MLAGIGRKVPDTVQTRSIRIRMTRKTSDTPAQKARSRTVAAEAEPLKARMQIAALQLGELPYVTDIARHLGHRDLDLWEPLFAIARTASPEWETVAEAAAIELSKAEPVLSIGMQLLAAIRNLFNDDDNPPFISTKAMIGNVADIFNREEASGLCGAEEAPWATFNRGRPINANQIANLLNEYDIKSGREHVGRNAYGPSGYFRNAFIKVWDAYLEPPEEPEAVVIPLFPGLTADSADSADRPEISMRTSLLQ
jgi:hypothetical protein